MSGGAVAYLTQSSYGRDKTEITINNYYTSNESPYRTAITGLAGDNIPAAETTTLANAYYTTQGEKASTTGNVTGIYDLSGGVWERIAGYISNGDSKLILTGDAGSSGGLMGATSTKNAEGYKTLSTRSYTVYPFDLSSDSYTDNYNTYKGLLSETYGYGDMFLEISTSGGGSTSWNFDYSRFHSSGAPFFGRGGDYHYTSSAGLFSFGCTGGNVHYYNGFRAVLVTE